MKSASGKAKGSAFEREISKLMSLWISHGTRDDIFWRSSLSGGRATVQFKKGRENRSQIGDLSAIDPLGEWLISRFVTEIKSYKNLGIVSGIITCKGLLYGF